MSKALEMIYCIRELLDLAPKDIRGVATYSWLELDEIFSYDNINMAKKELQAQQETIEFAKHREKVLNEKLNDYIEKNKYHRTKLDKIKEGINQINFNSLEEDDKILFGTIKSILEEE